MQMSAMAARMRRVLVLAKRSAYDMYVARHQDPTFTRLLSEPQVCLFGFWLVHFELPILISELRFLDILVV